MSTSGFTVSGILPIPSTVSGDYACTAYSTANPSTIHGQDVEICMPIRFSTTVSINALVTFVVTAGSAGSVVRLGIRNDNGGRPGTLLVDGGTTAAVTSNAYPSVTLSPAQSLTALTTYWLSCTIQNSTSAGTALTTKPTIRYQNQPYIQATGTTLSTSCVHGYRQVATHGNAGTTTGALPTSFGTAYQVLNLESCVMWVKFS